MSLENKWITGSSKVFDLSIFLRSSLRFSSSFSRASTLGCVHFVYLLDGLVEFVLSFRKRCNVSVQSPGDGHPRDNIFDLQGINLDLDTVPSVK